MSFFKSQFERFAPSVGIAFATASFVVEADALVSVTFQTAGTDGSPLPEVAPVDMADGSFPYADLFDRSPVTDSTYGSDGSDYYITFPGGGAYTSF